MFLILTRHFIINIIISIRTALYIFIFNKILDSFRIINIDINLSKTKFKRTLNSYTYKIKIH